MFFGVSKAYTYKATVSNKIIYIYIYIYIKAPSTFILLQILLGRSAAGVLADLCTQLLAVAVPKACDTLQ